ncbi:exported hypothetical protein [Sphingomonas sp. AX6]|nr:exported hypothetical protein [Sphingomonas sp. AX6]
MGWGVNLAATSAFRAPANAAALAAIATPLPNAPAFAGAQVVATLAAKGGQAGVAMAIVATDAYRSVVRSGDVAASSRCLFRRGRPGTRRAPQAHRRTLIGAAYFAQPPERGDAAMLYRPFAGERALFGAARPRFRRRVPGDRRGAAARHRRAGDRHHLDPLPARAQFLGLGRACSAPRRSPDAGQRSRAGRDDGHL